MDDTNTNTTNSTLHPDPEPQTPSALRSDDVDDLIFRGQGWLISDR